MTMLDCSQLMLGQNGVLVFTSNILAVSSENWLKIEIVNYHEMCGVMQPFA